MAESVYPRTNPSLLGRLAVNRGDEAAWQEFEVRYGPMIAAWCVRWGLQEADAQDLKQSVLLKLLRAFETFHYDPSQSFRAWLKTVTHHAWRDLVHARERAPALLGPALDVLLDALAAPDELAAELERGWRQELLEAAMARVRLRVRPVTWEAFRLTALEGLSGAEAAAQLGTRLTNVYKARSNVQKLLQEELAYLEGDWP